MTTNIEKRTYNSPLITKIALDNEISLILTSGGDNPDEPGSPTGQNSNAPDYFNNDPYKGNLR